MELTIETPRLLLTRLTNTDIDSKHLAWFHEMWTDDDITAWSIHGKTTTLLSSQEWMIHQLTTDDNMLYAVHVKPSPTPTPSTSTSTSNTLNTIPESPGQLIGKMGLRLQGSTPTIPPLPFPTRDSDLKSTDVAAPVKKLNFRSLGYSFFKAAWGHGYATEAASALLASYSTSVALEKEKGEEAFYVEASVGDENPASKNVLKKVGFKEVGWKTETERVFLAGKWQEPGYWVYGLYV